MKLRFDIYVNAQKRICTDVDGNPLGSDAIMEFFREEIGILCFHVVDDDGAAWPFAVGEVFEFGADNDWDQSTAVDILSEDDQFNIAGDWDNALGVSQIDPTAGLICCRYNTATVTYEAAFSTDAETVDAGLYLKVIDPVNGNYTVCQYACRYRNIRRMDGAVPPGVSEPTYPTWVQAIAYFVAKSLFDANTILKADTDDTPEALTVGEQTLVGRITGGEITALTATQVRTLLNVVESTACVLKSLFDANTILKADTDDTPEALTVGEQTIVGRITGGEITALTATQVQTLLGISTAQSQWSEWQNDDMDTGTVSFLELDAPDETTSWKVIGHLEKASEDVVAFELLAILKVVSDGYYGGHTKTLQVTIQHTAELVDLSNVAFSDGGDPAAHYCDYDAGTDRVRLRVLLGSDNWAAYGIVAKAGAATAGSVVIPAAYEHD